jgi:hypothetical protein
MEGFGGSKGVIDANNRGRRRRRPTGATDDVHERVIETKNTS